jgi:hypothetical protein
LQDPNPDDNWQDLAEMWMGDALEIGSLAGVKAYPRSAYDGDTLAVDAERIEPRAILPSAPEVWTKDYRGKTGLLEGYWQFDDHTSPGAGSTEGANRNSRGLNDPTFFDTAEIIWDDMTPRTNRGYGIPPTLLVGDFLQSLDLAVTQEQQYLSRGSIPSGAWVFENWDREQVIEWKEENQENVKGKPHKSLMFAGRGGDVRFEPMSMNFDELQFTERMKWYARVVASVFQVPTAVVGIEPERVNYNTFQGERENFESNTLGPYLQSLERVINDQLVGVHWDGYRFEFKPGMSESTRKMISDRVTREFEAGLIRRNEARRETGREPVDEEFDGFQDEVVEDTGGDGLDDILGESLSKDFVADVFRIVAPEDHEFDTGTVMAVGVDFPNSPVYVDWKIDEWPEDSQLSGPHVSIYDSIDDARQVAEGEVEMMDSLDAEDAAAKAAAVVKSAVGDSGNADLRKDEPLRETDEWYQFDVQPEMVEDVQAAIADDVRAVFDAVLEDDEVMDIIERLAADETEKSESELMRRLKEIFDNNAVVQRIERAVRDGSAEAVREGLEGALEGTDADPDVDVEAIEAQLADRDIAVAEDFAAEMSADIRDTVAEGWADGVNSREIADRIAEEKDINSGWTGAERIARQETHVAAGKAREEVAGQLDKVRIWNTAGDDRVRDAHQAMDGTWTFPGDPWEVEYDDRGVKEEDVPGSSEPGIGCRCVQLLRDRDEVDDADYAGARGLN